MDISKLIIDKLNRIEEQVLTTKDYIDKREAKRSTKQQLERIIKPLVIHN